MKLKPLFAVVAFALTSSAAFACAPEKMEYMYEGQFLDFAEDESVTAPEALKGAKLEEDDVAVYAVLPDGKQFEVAGFCTEE